MQKGLVIVIYALLALMVIFSFQAIANTGKIGFDKCVQEKCDQRGEKFCQKFREQNNCCQGAGGQMASSGSSYQCVF